jgi:hypothetical protein
MLMQMASAAHGDVMLVVGAFGHARILWKASSMNEYPCSIAVLLYGCPQYVHSPPLVNGRPQSHWLTWTLASVAGYEKSAAL